MTWLKPNFDKLKCHNLMLKIHISIYGTAQMQLDARAYITLGFSLVARANLCVCPHIRMPVKG